MSDRLVTVSITDRIATVTLDHKPSNLLSTSVFTELDHVLGKLEAADGVRVVILTAKGRFFCPGAT